MAVDFFLFQDCIFESNYTLIKIKFFFNDIKTYFSDQHGLFSYQLITY